MLGHAFGPNPERGVYRTTDGGKTWQQVLVKDADTGATDVCFDPTNPRILFAGLWQTRRRPWELTSGGPGSGLYVSRDGGDTWTQLSSRPTASSKGLPDGIWGKIGVAVAPSNSPARLRPDRGREGRPVPLRRRRRDLEARQRAPQPPPAGLVLLDASPSIRRTPTSSGARRCRCSRASTAARRFKHVKGPHHGDHHDLWIDPKNPQADDRQQRRRRRHHHQRRRDLVRAAAADRPVLPRQLPTTACRTTSSGTMQDIGTAAGPSNSLSLRRHPPRRLAHRRRRRDRLRRRPTRPTRTSSTPASTAATSRATTTAPARPATSASTRPTRPATAAEDLQLPLPVDRPDPGLAARPEDRLPRRQRPVPHHRRRPDAGTPISPDLTRNDKTKQKWSGGPITGDNTGVEIYGTIFAIAESPKQKGVLWAGSDDGLVHVSQRRRQDLEQRHRRTSPACPSGARSAASSRRRSTPARPTSSSTPTGSTTSGRTCSKTTDFGKTWKSLAAKLPQDVYLHAVREDPKQQGPALRSAPSAASPSRPTTAPPGSR